MKSPTTLETERLHLRPLTPDDAPAIFEACRDPRLTRYTLFDTHVTIDDTLRFLNEVAYPQYAEGWPDPLGIAYREEPDEIIGCVGANWTHGYKAMECSYWIAVPEWGKGIATEAVGRYTRFVFEATNAESVQARVIIGHGASERVLEKLGFQREATPQNAVRSRDRYWDTGLFRLLRNARLVTSTRQ